MVVVVVGVVRMTTIQYNTIQSNQITSLNSRISEYKITAKIISLFDEDRNNMKTSLNEPSLLNAQDTKHGSQAKRS